MSEIKVNKISPATGTDITLGDSGDTLTLPSGATIVNSGTATGFGGGGKIGQVLQTTHTGVETIHSTTMATIPNFSRAITPTATTSKILVIPNLHLGLEAGYCFGMSLFRDSTEIFIGDAAGSRDRNTMAGQYSNSEHSHNYTVHYLDSPSTTSEVVYSLKWNMQGGASIHFNRSYTDTNDAYGHRRCVSSFTVMEVLA